MKQLSHLLAVAHHRHFGRAAAAMNISQPALSRSIQTLEQSLGHQLLMRTRSRVELTDYGQVVTRHAEVMLRERERMQDALLRLQTDTVSEIRVGLGQYPAECFGIEAATALGTQQGRLLCQLRVADYRQITEELLSGRIDIGLCDITLAREDSRIHCVPVSRLQAFGYCRPDHPLLKRSPDTLRVGDLFQYPMVATNVPARVKGPRGEPIHQIDPLTMEALPALNVVTPAVANRLLANSDAIGYAPLSMIEKQLAEKQVALLPLRDPQLHIDVGHIFPAAREPNVTIMRFMEETERLARLHEQHCEELEKKHGVAATP
ncbi:MAG: LysR family transcriptional regulator [Halieaceae bacterium]|jgi:DNA-binding transcriptional LysR family regulator|nr:LysR family transcriptional regulator [Halieaceae bacterium]